MIYLDNAATTAVYPECTEILNYYNTQEYFNPSARYGAAVRAAGAVRDARETIAKIMRANRDEVIFTASGSESDNIAMLCSLRRKSGRVIISAAEHSAVYRCGKELERRGYELVLAPVDAYGRLDMAAFEKCVTPDTVLVSIMHVSNETGAINDIASVVRAVRAIAPSAIIHSDGVQAFCKIRTDVKSLGVDLYSVSGHKIHAPKGVGALYVGKGVHLSPFVFGGGQETGIRSATENVAGICAFAKAAQIKSEGMKNCTARLNVLRQKAVEYLKNNIDDMVVLSDTDMSVPNILSIAVKGIRGEVAVHCLDDAGVCVGTGSACSSHSADKRIAQALGLDSVYAEGMLRISTSDFTQDSDMEYAMLKLVETVNTLRNYTKR